MVGDPVPSGRPSSLCGPDHDFRHHLLKTFMGHKIEMAPVTQVAPIFSLMAVQVPVALGSARESAALRARLEGSVDAACAIE